jgi:hypothetical protein
VGNVLLRNSPIQFRDLSKLIKQKQSEIISSAKVSTTMSDIDIRNTLALLFQHNLVTMTFNEFD